MKIVIMGYSGSGKSTLARKLGQHFGCDVLHFDTVQFLPKWEVRGQKEKLQITFGPKIRRSRSYHSNSI